MTEIEIRPYAEGVEVRSVDTEAGPKLRLAGIAIRYGARSKDLGGFRERIMPGAATEVIQKSDVMAYEEHRSERYLGRTGNGTLRLIDTKESLRYEVDLPDTTVGREVAALAERGDYAGSSFGFRALNEDWTKDTDGTPLRTITGFRNLRDVGPTVRPAYAPTTAEAALRNLASEKHLELRSLLDAAAAGELAALLDGERAEPGDDDTETDSGLIVHRRPQHLFL